MMMNRKFRIALIAGVIAVFCVIYTCWFLSLPNYRNNKKRIGLKVDTDFSYKSIYQSDQGFGNDLSSICRFTLKKPKKLNNFVLFSQLNESKKEDVEKFYNTEFKSEWEDYDKSAKYDSVINELFALKASSKTRYLLNKISDMEYSYELYMYNDEMNVGYYIVSII